MKKAYSTYVLAMLVGILALGLTLVGCPPASETPEKGDTTAPTLSGAGISGNHRVVTLTFSENIANATTGDAALKAAVTFASDGTNFAALADGDSVAISGATLVVDFAAALTTATNKIKVAANALKDAAGNKTAEVTTGAIDASTQAQNQVINIAAIAGVTAPATGAAPAAGITATTQYTGAVAWAITDGAALNGSFAASTAYTATITLTAKSGYTLTGVGANFFTVAGATEGVTNAANTGVITAKFPATGATDNRATLTAGGAVNVAYSATTANVTFTGATGVTGLTTDDFTVTGGTFISASVTGGTATVTVGFAANTANAAKTIVVGIKDTSSKIKGSASVTITQAADTRVELTASSATANAAAADTSKAVTFTGATGVTGLTTADFTVTGGTFTSTDVNGGTATVTVGFAANTANAAKTIRVAVNPSSTKIKGSTSVTITQAAAAGGGAKTLVITGISAEVLGYASTDGLIGLFPVGTTPEQAFNQTGLVASADLKSEDIIVSPTPPASGPYIITIPLYSGSGTSGRWTGSGTYDIYVGLGLTGDEKHYYKVSSVNFSLGTTTVLFSSATDLSGGGA